MSNSTTQVRFTAIDVLVGLAILGAFAVLLLPALQAAREATRKHECANDMRNLGLAYHNYYDVFKAAPPAAIVVQPKGKTPSKNFTDPEYGTSFFTMMMMFIDDTAPYDNYNFKIRSSEPKNKEVCARQSKVLLCPSAERVPNAKLDAAHPDHYAKGNFAINCGAGRANSAEDFFDTNFRGCFSYSSATSEKNRHQTYGAGFGQIVDGLSNVVVFSETLPLASAGDSRGVWARAGGAIFSGHTSIAPVKDKSDGICTPNMKTGGEKGQGSENSNGNDHPLFCDKDKAASALVCTSAPAEGDGGVTARSQHPGAVNATMGDASVRSVANDVDPLVWRSSLAIRDGSIAHLPNRPAIVIKEYRKWSDSTGKFSIEADFAGVKIGSGFIYLRDKNGRVIEIAINRLSEADRKYLDAFKVTEPQ